MATIVLWLFILNLGTAFGAGIYEARIVVPQWFSRSTPPSIHAATMQKLDVGRTFWSFVTTIPLTLLTIANLILAWQSAPPAHSWWLAAALITLAERIGTFTFFIPTAIKFQQANQQPMAQLNRLIRPWIILNYVRNALTLIAWICALQALSA